MNVCDRCGNNLDSGGECPNCARADELDSDQGYYDYTADEWYDDSDADDYEPEIAETSRHAYLHKAMNGHLSTSDVFGYRYWGQDWGETVDQWDEYHYRLNEIRPEIRTLAIKLGRDLKPGETVDFPYWLYEDEDDESPADEAAPTSVDDIPF